MGIDAGTILEKLPLIHHVGITDKKPSPLQQPVQPALQEALAKKIIIQPIEPPSAPPLIPREQYINTTPARKKAIILPNAPSATETFRKSLETFAKKDFTPPTKPTEKPKIELERLKKSIKKIRIRSKYT